MIPQISNRPIPGQSLTTVPGNAQYEQPPAMIDPELILKSHLQRLSKPKAMEDMLDFIDQGIDVRTLVEGILRSAVLNGIHSVDVSLIIAPILHEFIRGLPLAAGIEFEDGFEDHQEVEEAMYRMAKPTEEPIEEEIEKEMPMKEDKPSGLMARV